MENTKKNESVGNKPWQEYSKVKAENPEAILFYRVGDFYELYGNDAKTASDELDLVLTGRDVGLAERMPMCGVPYHRIADSFEHLQDRGFDVRLSEKTLVSEALLEQQLQKLKNEWSDSTARANPESGHAEFLMEKLIEIDHELTEKRRSGKSITTEDATRWEALQVNPSKSQVKLTPYQQKNLERLSAIEQNTPEEMKAMPHWCVYKTFYDKATESRKKIILKPYDAPEGEKRANFNDKSHFTSFDVALKYAKDNNFEGLSFAIKDTGFNCIDLDHCLKNGAYKDLAQRMLKDLSDTYCERSRSGDGLHFFLKDNILEGNKYKNRNYTDKEYQEYRAECKKTKTVELKYDKWLKTLPEELQKEIEKRSDIEVFETWGFVSMTGDIISKTNHLSACPEALKADIRSEVGEKEQPKRQATNYVNNDSDRDVIERIQRSKKANEFNTLYNGGSLCFKQGSAVPDPSRNDNALLNILAFFTNCDAGQMERLFKASGAFRSDKSQSYITRSINYAIENLYERPKHFGNKGNSYTQAKGK